MRYLCISNRGSLNRKLLELIGLSTKRDRMADKSVIGNKGSGSKLAAVAALQLGISTGITSRDPRGSYFLEFDDDEITVEGVVAHHVHYHYYLRGDKDDSELERLRFPSNMVLEAFPDWRMPIGSDDKRSFKVLREHICNAYDADRDFVWSVSEGRHFASEGRTSVFLGYSDEFRRIFEMPERYFKFLSKHRPCAVVEGVGEIWPKSDAANTRLFLLGVLVDCDGNRDRTSLFDYSLFDKHMLSEERILKSASAYLAGVGTVFARLEDIDICRTVLRGIEKRTARFEERALGCIRDPHLSKESKATWLAAAHEVFGEKIALPAINNEVANSDVVQMYGYKLLRLGSHDFQCFLRDIGVPNADDIFPKNPEDRVELVLFENLEEESRKRFDVAWGLFAKHFPYRAQYPIFFFHPLDDAMKRMGGFAGYGETAYREIWIQTKTRTTLPSSLKEVLLILEHESRHCFTGLSDHERGFGEAAEEVIFALIVRIAAMTRDEGGDPLAPLGNAMAVYPTFGDPSSKKARVVGEGLARLPPSSHGEAEIEIEINSILDGIANAILDDAAKKK